MSPTPPRHPLSAPLHGAVHGPPLARLLEHTALAVQAVREGRSLSDLLPRVPEALRPGVQALAFLVLRRLGGAMEVRLRLAAKTPPPAVEALLLVALALLWPDAAPPYPDHTLVDQAVAAARQRVPAAAGFINAVLRRFLRERAQWVDAASHSPLGAYNHPPWWVERLRQDWPGHWQALLHAANQHPPMVLRVNARRCTAPRYVERLAQHGIVAHLLPLPRGSQAGAAARWAHNLAHDLTHDMAAGRAAGGAASGVASGTTEADRAAVLLAVPRPVSQLPGFAEGEVSVQDAAAQWAAPLLLGGHGVPGEGLAPLRTGARVLDACAAPGGKSAHLLELADLDLVALDVDAQRLARVHDNLKRLRLPVGASGSSSASSGSVQVLAGDARQPAAWWDGRPFDAILLDAPCTASGIVRRHPDVRWLRRPGDISSLAATQAQILAALWPLLAPGGRLLYATCSLFKAEGEEQIDAFLQRLGPAAARRWPHAPGHLLPLIDNAPQGDPGASATASIRPMSSFPAVRAATPSAPRGPSSDGFFYALIEKT